MAATLHRSPRIALVIDRFDGRRGGAALWTRGFAAWLGACNCDVHVLARSVGPAEAHLPITFHPIQARRSPLAFALAVSKRLAAIRPLISHDMGAAIGCDVLQPHVGSGLACWNGSVASYPAWLRPIKRLCGLSPRYRRLRQLRAAQYNGGSAAFIAVSHKVARDMQSLHHVPAARIRVVHNGVDLSRFTSVAVRDARPAIRRFYGIGDDEVLLIAVAHNFRLKGIPGLIRAVEQLHREGDPVRLLLCGGHSRSNDSGDVGHDAILDCGRVEDVAPFYAAADICVHPTFYDACSLVTLEAMAAGLPVITTRANGASELITHGVNGVVLDFPHDDQALAAALRPLVRDANVRRALGSAGRGLVEAHSVERNYHGVAAAYADVLALRSVAAAAMEPLFDAANPPRVGIRRALGAPKAPDQFLSGNAAGRALR
jgi:UDP-glucose:(heptosyl)LPS alpha-1,3-glucosyltransferase